MRKKSKIDTDAFGNEKPKKKEGLMSKMGMKQKKKWKPKSPKEMSDAMGMDNETDFLEDIMIDAGSTVIEPSEKYKAGQKKKKKK